MSKMNIAVFFGSRSCEHDVSIVSALQCIEATKAAGFNVTPVYISRDGLWYTGEPLENIETFREFNPMTKGITRVTLDVTANAGDLWAWPPQRAGLGSAIGMDKIAMKQILRGAGFPVLDFVWFTREQLKKERQAVIERVEKEIKYPAFIKPAALGSSIGVSRVKNREELERALDVAASYDRRILVEVGVVHPVEINCAAVGYGEDVRASVCEMPVPSSNDTFLDFWQKYLRNASTKGEDSRGMKSLSRVVPAPIGDELTGRIQTMTCDIFKLLDCCGTVRVDFILDQNDMLFVNEPNTIPGSLAFYLWKASGLDFPKLIEKMVEDALRAHADKNSSVFAYDSSILKKVAAGTKGSKR